MLLWFSILTLLAPVAQAQEAASEADTTVETATEDGQDLPTDEHSEETETGSEPTTENVESTDEEGAAIDASERMDETEEVDEGETSEDETRTTTESSEDHPSVPYEIIDDEALAADQALAAEQLARYCDDAHSVVIAQVLRAYQQEQIQQVSLMVEEQLRGRARGVLDIEIRMPSPTNDPTRIYPLVANGYRVILFLDRRGRLLEGNSLFLLQGGYAWRNKRYETFLEPAANQDWVSHMDPARDYIMFSMDDIHACLD